MVKPTFNRVFASISISNISDNGKWFCYLELYGYDVVSKNIATNIYKLQKYFDTETDAIHYGLTMINQMGYTYNLATGLDPNEYVVYTMSASKKLEITTLKYVSRVEVRYTDDAFYEETPVIH